MSIRFFVVLIAVSAVCAAASVADDNLEAYTFEDFVAEYKKPYSLQANDGEYAKRRVIFEDNLRTIKTHNAKKGETWTMGVNEFADMTEKEFTAKMTGYNMKMAVNNQPSLRNAFAPQFIQNTARPSVLAALPEKVDWREKNVVTPVKNQGQCGSCWAFAATETYESIGAIATGKLFTLSAQQATSCVANPQKCGGSGGCDGATCELAFDYWARAGVTTNDKYPYSSGGGSTGACKFNNQTMPPVLHNKGFIKLPNNNLEAHMNAIVNVGPLAISAAASPWMFYRSGIFSGCTDLTNIDVNHAVVLVGYGIQGTTKYWIVRNSWGSGWGEAGYIRMIRRDVEVCGKDPTPEHGTECPGGPSSVTVCGECGMLWDTSYPTQVTLA